LFFLQRSIHDLRLRAIENERRRKKLRLRVFLSGRSISILRVSSKELARPLKISSTWLK
jgi:hypothetical protein